MLKTTKSIPWGKERFFLPIMNLVPGILVLMSAAPVTYAYIGPGSGISVVGSLLGLLATILLAVAAVLLWPFRRLLKKRRSQKISAVEDDNSAEDTTGIEAVAVDANADTGKPPT